MGTEHALASNKRNRKFIMNSLMTKGLIIMTHSKASKPLVNASLQRFPVQSLDAIM